MLFWAVVLEKTLESHLDSRRSVNPKGNQPWIFIGWIFIGWTEVETPILWLLDAKRQLTGKDSEAGKDRGQKEKWVTEDEMAWWNYQLNEHEFEQNLRDSEGQWRKPGVLQSVGSQRIRHDWATELQQQQLETSWFWLYRLLSAKWCLCFLICCLGLS